MFKYLQTLGIPIAIVIANFVLFSLLFPQILAGMTGEVIFNLIRVFAVLCAGWLIVERCGAAISAAAYSGIVILFIAHVVLKGGLFLVQPLWDPGLLIHDGFKAFLGVLVSFLMFVPIAMVIAALGGWAAKRFHTRLKSA